MESLGLDVVFGGMSLLGSRSTFKVTEKFGHVLDVSYTADIHGVAISTAEDYSRRGSETGRIMYGITNHGEST
jgi:hypothetical protein